MPIQKDKLTEAQKQELERLRHFIARNRLSSRMNGTKWRAAIDTVLALEGYRPSFRFKAVMAADGPPEGAWDAGFPANLPLFNSMEWLELNARSFGAAPKGDKGDYRQALKQALDAAGIPAEDAGSGIRIRAYTRS